MCAFVSFVVIFPATVDVGPRVSQRLFKFSRTGMADALETSRAGDKRDRLSSQLAVLERNVEEVIYERRKDRHLGRLEYLSPKERLGIFLEWHRQLNVLHGSLGRSVDMLRRTSRSGRDIQVLKQLAENVGDLAAQSEPLSALAQRRLEEIEEERHCALGGKVFRPSREVMALIAPDSDTDDDLVEGILREAESIRRISIESSLRLKTEMDTMRAQSAEMARNLVALNRILESRKRQLVEHQRLRNQKPWSPEHWHSYHAM